MIEIDFIYNSELANILVVKYVKIKLFDTKIIFLAIVPNPISNTLTFSK